MLEENVDFRNKSLLFLVSEFHLGALFTANSCQCGLDDFSFSPCSNFPRVYSCYSGELTKCRRACFNYFGISY